MEDKKLYLNMLIKSHYEHTPLCFVQSFGCAQNFADGEKLVGYLEDVGFYSASSIDEADLIIYNTCAIRENAEEKVFGLIGELKHLKLAKPDVMIGICGCMAQQEHISERIKKTYNQVDLVFGTFSYTQLYEMLCEVLESRKRVFNNNENGTDLSYVYQKRTDKVIANVPIMYGCNNFCSYCIVPYVRGRERSRPFDEVVSEVTELVLKGYKEINLLGQNVNSYEYGFPRLLRTLNAIDGDFRIRFMSSHPKDASFDLIDAICECDKVCKHLHLPVQCGNDEILKLMNRKYTTSDYLKIVDYARNKMTDFSFSTDIIVGFPGETYEQFCDTKEFIKRVSYDNIYSFVYSKRNGTKAALLEDNISSKEKGLWIRELILEQREVATRSLSKYIGKILKVLPTAMSDNNEGMLTGKCDENIIVEFLGDKSLIGDFVNIKILKATNWALLGEVAN